MGRGADRDRRRTAVGILRTVVYRSGDIDHTRTMRVAATFALTLGLVGLVCLCALSVAILLR